MANTPKIRFEGFTGDWEERKLGDLFEIIDTKHATAHVSDIKTQYRMIRTNCIRDGRLIVENTDSVTEEVYEEWSERIHLREGDLVFTREAPMGESAVIKEDGNKYFPGQRIVSMRSRGNSNAYFMNQLFYADEFRKEIRIREAASTTVANFGIPHIKNYSVPVPCIEEQAKLGEFFGNLDTLITLHQRKCDETKELKNYMLQKMFPKAGEKVPEIRFAGFTDDWEQRKLGEIFKEYSEKKHEELPTLTIIQGGGTILREESDRVLQYDKNSLSGYKMVKKDDFIVHLRSFEGGLEKANSDGIISPAYHTFHGDNIDSRFYYPFFRSKRFIDVLLKPHVYGIRDGKSIDIDGMKTIMIPVPLYEEQKKIGEYLEAIDNLITLHQRKCDNLKTLKQYMLQNMFPQKG